MKDKFLLGIAGFTFLVLAGGVLIAYRMVVPQVAPSKGAEVQVSETAFDWGEIPIDGGNVEKEFEIKNAGSQPLTLFNIKTSCMCTTAQVISDKEASPFFGMHEQSDYKITVAAGETARLKVVFDPAYHGPEGIGPVTRQISVSTNDPKRPMLSFMLSAMVVR